MGRRKERRAAAAASLATGRKVKLDLFAEQPPPLTFNGEHSNNEKNNDDEEEEGEEGELREVVIPSTKLSSSSSTQSFSTTTSSGKQRQENPLMLLGQYSDEEEETNAELTEVPAQTDIDDINAQVEEFVATACGDTQENMAECVAVEHIKQEELDNESSQLNAAKDLEGSGVQESDSVPLEDPHKGEESTGLVSDPWTSGMQVTGEVTFGWKLVMHEETNQYYYWNVETGETSWEVPAIFTQGTELGTEQKVPLVIEEMESAPLNTDAYGTLQGEPVVYSSVATDILYDGPYLMSIDEEKCVPRDQISIKNEAYLDENMVYPELSSGIHQKLNSTVIGTSACSEGIDGHSLMANEHQLVSYAESLIHKLKDLEGSNIQLQEGDWISKCILEIEIRLSDLRSLLAYGSSILPFWMHSEEKLKGLERTISDHISQCTTSGQTNEVDTGKFSFCKDDSTSHQSSGGDSELNNGDQAVVPSRHSSPNIDTSGDTSTLNDVNVKHILPSASASASPSPSPSRYTGSVVKGNIQEVNEALLPNELVPQSVLSSVEDEDMDVDMEVDEEATINEGRSRDALGANKISPPEHRTQPDRPAGELPPTVLEKEYDVPPPPDEDWIPPPPPDTEPVPPPPPDDPPTPTYTPQPSYSETAPHLPYSDQYNMSYSVPGSEYYLSTMTGVPNLNYYTHTEEPQVVESQSVQYFGPVSTTYSEAATVMVNPMDPIVYYSLPNGSVPPVPVVSCLESSGFYGESGSVSYHGTTADQTGTVKSLAESKCSSLPNLKGDSDALAAQVIPLSTTVQAQTTAAPVPLTTAASVAVVPSTSAAKPPTKVLRTKKRTIAVAPTLRSNKKVSSLVDKWKAAKEEMHEDEEDEPQNAYEMLERKRQREIEEWRAHQIATGEAKDNANFQPLGGDWRERIKRRRAKSIKEKVLSPPVSLMNEKQPPDLTELSKDLPSGWQAYWDESSKKAYYGNTITSETTWTKPTQ